MEFLNLETKPISFYAHVLFSKKSLIDTQVILVFAKKNVKRSFNVVLHSTITSGLDKSLLKRLLLELRVLKLLH
jgi:hypothetical protein